MELHQSPLYKRYMTSLKWGVYTIDNTLIFTKHIPFVGTLAKIQRPTHLPSVKKLLSFFQEQHITSLAIEPRATENEKLFHSWYEEIRKHIAITRTQYLPTKTIIIDLTDTEDVLFKKLTEAKRRAVRRAQKNNLIVSDDHNPTGMIRLKATAAGFLGFITTTGMKELYDTFGKENTATLLAYATTQEKQKKLLPVAGILLLFHQRTAYYWIAGATKKGKSLFAPTLLAWHALLQAKKHGCTHFDFTGVWDERLPKEHPEWKGFTKFKEGFGGTAVYYPLPPHTTP